MRKIFIQFYLLVVLIIIASCSNENIIDAERNAIKQVDPNALSENEVIFYCRILSKVYQI